MIDAAAAATLLCWMQQSCKCSGEYFKEAWGRTFCHGFFPELETHLREFSNCKYKNKLGRVWRSCKKTCLKMSFDNTLQHSITLCNALQHTAKL